MIENNKITSLKTWLNLINNSYGDNKITPLENGLELNNSSELSRRQKFLLNTFREKTEQEKLREKYKKFIEKTIDTDIKKQFFSTRFLNWTFRKFINKILIAGKKEFIENLIYDIENFGQKKKSLYNIKKNFFHFFFLLIRQYRPRLELLRKKRRKGKTSALAMERRLRTKSNKFVIPNCLSYKKQITLVISWITLSIKKQGLRKQNKLITPKLAQKKMSFLKPILKGRKQLQKAVKDKKKQRLLNKLVEKQKLRFQVYPLKRKVKKVIVSVFFRETKKSFLYKNLNLYIKLLGKQSAINKKKRWK